MMADWPPEPARASIRRQVTGAIAGGGICGVVLAAGRSPGNGWVLAAGHEEPGALGAPALPGAGFDLASLTKVMATLPVVLVLAAAGQLRLGDRAQRFLPSFRDAGRGDITLGQLLAHTSGLPATRRYYRKTADPAAMRADVLAERPQTAPGAAVAYSDIGFLVLGFVIEAVCGVTVAVAARELIFQPLAMTATGFTPEPAALRFMPTESHDGQPALRGVVHDRNAQLLGGVAGHAGLFAPVADVATYLAAWAGSVDPPWGRGLSGLALRRHTPPSSPPRGLGWVLAGREPTPILPRCWPASGAGHTGFTGTSLAFDPASHTWLALLTNAIRCGRDHRPVAALRSAVHETIAEAISTGQSGPQPT